MGSKNQSIETQYQCILELYKLHINKCGRTGLVSEQYWKICNVTISSLNGNRHALKNVEFRFIDTDSMINCIKIANTMCSLYWKKTSSSLSTRWNKRHSQSLVQVALKKKIIMRWLCWKPSCCHYVAIAPYHTNNEKNNYHANIWKYTNINSWTCSD